MTQANDEFDVRANEFIFSNRGREFNAIINDNQGQISANKLMREVFMHGWQAAKQQPLKRLSKDDIEFVVNGWTTGDYLELANAIMDEMEKMVSKLKADNENLARINNLQAQDIVELQAHINDLREALEEMVAMEELEGNSCEPQRHILSKTPAQSLQEHDNEVIERCAKVCDESYAFDSDGFAKAIRALKGNECLKKEQKNIIQTKKR